MVSDHSVVKHHQHHQHHHQHHHHQHHHQYHHQHHHHQLKESVVVAVVVLMDYGWGVAVASGTASRVEQRRAWNSGVHRKKRLVAWRVEQRETWNNMRRGTTWRVEQRGGWNNEAGTIFLPSPILPSLLITILVRR